MLWVAAVSVVVAACGDGGDSSDELAPGDATAVSSGESVSSESPTAAELADSIEQDAAEAESEGLPGLPNAEGVRRLDQVLKTVVFEQTGGSFDVMAADDCLIPTSDLLKALVPLSDLEPGGEVSSTVSGAWGDDSVQCFLGGGLLFIENDGAHDLAEFVEAYEGSFDLRIDETDPEPVVAYEVLTEAAIITDPDTDDPTPPVQAVTFLAGEFRVTLSAGFESQADARRALEEVIALLSDLRPEIEAPAALVVPIQSADLARAVLGRNTGGGGSTFDVCPFYDQAVANDLVGLLAAGELAEDDGGISSNSNEVFCTFRAGDVRANVVVSVVSFDSNEELLGSADRYGDDPVAYDFSADADGLPGDAVFSVGGEGDGVGVFSDEVMVRVRVLERGGDPAAADQILPFLASTYAAVVDGLVGSG